jgi:phosphoglycerate dehydrogenase-like enzyme/predicted dehydrogenase
MKDTEIIRLGIVGAGKMTLKRHLPALVRLQDEGVCSIVAICDIDIDAAKKAASLFGISDTTHEASSLVTRDDLDAVCLFGPAEVHYKFGLEALRAGKHIFVEKPPARTLQQLQEMVAVAAQEKRIAVSGFNRRFQKNITYIKNAAVPESIHTAEAFFHKANAGVASPFGMRSWLGVSAIHAIDVLCFVMGGRPTELYAFGNGGKGEVPENFSAILRWGDRHAVFSSNNSAGARTERYVFHGSGISYTAEGPHLRIQSAMGEDEVLENPADSTGGIYEEFESFFSAIQTGEKTIHTLSQCTSALHLLTLIEDGFQGAIDWSVVEDGQSKIDVAQSVKVPTLREVSHVSKPALLILNASVLRHELSALQETYKIVYEDDLVSLTKEEKQNVVAILTGGAGATAPTPQMFTELPSVRVLCVVGASVKKWGADAALKEGISVINTADVYAEAVAEFVLMQALIGLRKASMSHDAMRLGGWEFSVTSMATRIKLASRRILVPLIPSQLKTHLRKIQGVSRSTITSHKKNGQALSGKQIGMVGYGEITKKAIPLFKAFDCEILVHSEYLTTDEAQVLGVRSAPLHEVLQSDVVSLHRGLSQRTERSFGVQEINTLRSGTVFINAARAGLVDTKALVTRLRKEDIFACLDVFDVEPLPERDTLRTLRNVFLTSHIAGSIKHVDGLSEKSSSILIEKMTAFLNDDRSVAIDTAAQFNNMT